MHERAFIVNTPYHAKTYPASILGTDTAIAGNSRHYATVIPMMSEHDVNTRVEVHLWDHSCTRTPTTVSHEVGDRKRRLLVTRQAA